MSKLSVDDIKQILEKDLPNYQLTREEEASMRDLGAADKRSPPLAEVSSQNIASLREKYLGASEGADSGTSDVSAAAGSDENVSNDAAEDVIVAVSPKTSSQPWDRGSRPKAAVISGSEKRVIGEQG